MKVLRKQPNSRMCLVCGLKNPAGMQASFFDVENGECVSLFTARDEHQSYPGRVHGGMITALLDETIGRAIMGANPEEFWAVTAELVTRYKKPVPIGVELRVVGRVVSEEGRVVTGTGELLLPDGGVAATAEGRYVRLPLAKIADFDAEVQEWRVVAGPDDPVEIPLP
jgi:uncharacterized protein (TIGR00369 family)